MNRFLRPLLVNGRLKLAALALALLLWVSVSAEEPASQWLTVPVEVALLDPMHTLVGGPVPSQVEVRFSGPGRDLWELALNRPSLVLPVRNAEEDDQIFVLDPEMVRVPQNLEVAARDVRPSSVRLLLQRLVRREVPVRVRIPEQLPDGWVWTDRPQSRPATVELIGPEAALDEIDTLYTVPVQFSQSDSMLSRTLALDTTGLGEARLETREVRVLGRAERVVRRTIDAVPINAPDGFRVAPSTVSVDVTGPARRVAALDAEALRARPVLDSLVGPVPAAGAQVPLRLDGVPTGVTASPSVGSVRVRPPLPVRDTVVPDTIQDSAGREFLPELEGVDP